MSGIYIEVYEYTENLVPHTNIGFFKNGTYLGTYGSNLAQLDGNPFNGMEGGVFDESGIARTPSNTTRIDVSETAFDSMRAEAIYRVANTNIGNDHYYLIGSNCVDFVNSMLEMSNTGIYAHDFMSNTTMDFYSEAITILRGMANDFGQYWMDTANVTGMYFQNLFYQLKQIIENIFGGSKYYHVFTQEYQEMIDYNGDSPLALDLNGDGIQTISPSNSIVEWDNYGTGIKKAMGWLSPEDGFLAIDSNNNGLIDNGLELFGGEKSGEAFGKLRVFDINFDGVIDSLDPIFDQLKIWQDLNSNGITDLGELQSLSAHGVTSLNLNYSGSPQANNGNAIVDHSHAMINGVAVEFSDVFFFSASESNEPPEGFPEIMLVGQASAVTYAELEIL